MTSYSIIKTAKGTLKLDWYSPVFLEELPKFIEFGLALKKLKDNSLWRGEFESWEKYLKHHFLDADSVDSLIESIAKIQSVLK